VSFIVKKEESPIVVPLLVSEDEETKSEECSPLPSLHYPTSSSSSSRASSWLSSYHTRSPALCYSLVKRGDSIYIWSPKIDFLALSIACCMIACHSFQLLETVTLVNMMHQILITAFLWICFSIGLFRSI
jgi:hypothetical protein